jgi:FkbM family methyltransferase
MVTDRKLIFDVGAHDGADSGYYLSQGYRVVAVEADPSLARELAGRFAAEVEAGRLIVVNAAVMESDRELVEFYVSTETTESSLIRQMAERPGGGTAVVGVRGRSLCSLFGEYGIPWYCKVDIEGYDATAIGGLGGCQGRPAFISCEVAGHPIGEIAENNALLYEVLDALSARGYRQFKLVDQESFLVLDDDGHYDWLHRRPVRTRTKLERWMGMFTPRFNNRRWLLRRRMPEAGSVSGPFGEGLAGEWASFGLTRKRMWRHFSDYYQYTKNKSFIFWVDVHAKY